MSRSPFCLLLHSSGRRPSLYPLFSPEREKVYRSPHMGQVLGKAFHTQRHCHSTISLGIQWLSPAAQVRKARLRKSPWLHTRLNGRATIQSQVCWRTSSVLPRPATFHMLVLTQIATLYQFISVSSIRCSWKRTFHLDPKEQISSAEISAEVWG